MKNQKLKIKRLEKDKRITKDIIRKRNLRKYAPKITVELKKPIFDLTEERNEKGSIIVDKRGAPLVKKVGEKIVKRKISKFTYTDGKSKKFRGRKKNRKRGGIK